MGNILVATPGRLNDFVERGRISYSKLQFLVLDEADRMLDMGFKEDIGRMVRNTDMPSKGTRQTLMFSATYPDEIQKMAFEFMSNYLFLAVGVVGGACSDVSQTFLQVPMYEKREKLLDLVRVLADSQQNVPNWLEDEARRNPEGHSGTSGSRFGAKDIRTQTGFVQSNMPIEGDERWDL